MGVIVGGQGGGTTLGVAPDPKWVAVKIFNDACGSTVTASHQGFQWLLDPDGTGYAFIKTPAGWNFIRSLRDDPASPASGTRLATK